MGINSQSYLHAEYIKLKAFASYMHCKFCQAFDDKIIILF